MSRGERIRGVLRWAGILPGETPVAYSGLQIYARNTFTRCRTEPKTGSIVGKLLAEQAAGGADALTDLDIAAECADHLDAGLKTTSDTLMFAIWALSLPKNQALQHRLAMEVASLTESDGEGMPTVEACDRLPFLDAVIKETLRLYAPIPASQPRTSPHDVMVDGYPIPAGTVVSCQAYSLHRNPDVFRDPSTFQPDRWLEADEDLLAEMKRLWWPFSSGARMCLGSQ
jgi:cytochrome P450